MLMSTRTKEIIQIITLEHGYITMKKIADKMKISERTVYRNMNEISDVLAEYDLTLETVSKKGVKIVGSGKNREELKLYLEAEVYTQVVEPKERRNRILFELIHSENYIKAEALAIDLKTSLPTIRNDLKKISELCESYQIELVQKKGEGIYLKGHQKERDCLLVNILRETIEIERLLSWMDGNTESFHPFLLDIEEKYGYADMIKRCHKSLQNLNMDFEEAGYYMEDGSYLEFVILTALMIRRNQMGKSKKEINQLDENISKEEKQLTKRAIQYLKREFMIDFKDYDHKELCHMIHILSMPTLSKELTAQTYELRGKVRKFIEHVEEEMGIYLSQDQKLMDGLVAHMDKALKRIRSGMSISNPIIREIEKDYKELFQIIKRSARLVFSEDYFPEDEIGYLVLYFAVSLDNITKKTFRILVVCSSGMGSSKMLASRLEREIPEIYVRKIVSLIGLGKEDLSDYDLILSTIPLYLDQEMYLKVSPLLNPQELALVKEKIRRHKHKTLRRIEERGKDAERWEKMNGMLALARLNQFTQQAMKIIENFTILSFSKDASEEDVVDKIGEICKNCGFELVREQNEINQGKSMESYFVIPATKVSYFEYFSKDVKEVMLMVCYFKGEEVYDWNSEEMIKSMVVMVYPEEVNDLEREIINNITDLIIEDSNMIDLIEKGDKDGICQSLSFQFMEYIKHIM